MIVNGLSIEKIENYDPFNPRAKKNGMVTEWVGRNEYGNAVAFGDTKAECIKEARSNKSTAEMMSQFLGRKLLPRW